MKIDLIGFHASIHLREDIYCPNCNGRLKQIMNGFLGTAWICKKCHSVYQLHLIKVPKKELNKEYMDYALKEIKSCNSKE